LAKGDANAIGLRYRDVVKGQANASQHESSTTPAITTCMPVLDTMADDKHGHDKKREHDEHEHDVK